MESMGGPRRKAQLLMLTALLVAVMLAVAIGINQSRQPRPVETSTATPTWKTYENRELGFGFKYPPTLIREDPIPTISSFYNASRTSDGIYIRTKDHAYDPRNFSTIFGPVVEKDLQSILVGGKPVYRFSIGDAGCESDVYVLPAARGTKTAYLEFTSCIGEKERIVTPIKDQVLSSFRFTL